MTNFDSCIYVCDTNTPEWLELRKTGIGTSDAWRVLMSPFSLYLEKRGEIAPEHLDGEWLDWGHKLEPVIIRELGERIGMRTQQVSKMYRSKAEPWMLASLDGLVYSPDGKVVATVEAKNVGAWNADEWENGAPERFRFQSFKQQFMCGVNRGYVGALIGGNRFVFDELERDDDWLRAYIKRGRDLWRRIETGDRPPVDDTPETARALKELHPKDNGQTVQLPGSLVEIDAELVSFKARAKTIESEIKLREAQIKEAIGAATFGVLANGATYSWKTHHKGAYQVAASDVRSLTRKQPKEAA